MENHADREEVEEAMIYGAGESNRYSDTLMERTFYYAKRISDGSILRVSRSYSSVLPYLLYALLTAGGFLLAAAALSLIAARLLSASIANPINQIRLDTSDRIVAPYRELIPLVDRISVQQRQIKEQCKT